MVDNITRAAFDRYDITSERDLQEASEKIAAGKAVYSDFTQTLVPSTEAPGLTDWCERGDSNPHGFTRQILSLVRLPIPPLSQCLLSKTCVFGSGLSDGIAYAPS